MNPHFSLRRYKFALQYYIKLISYPQNPAYKWFMEIRYKNLFENKEKAIKPFNQKIPTLLNEIKINPKIIHNTILPKTAPWTINQPIIKLDLTKLSKNQNTPHHLPRELPQHPKQLSRPPPHQYRWIQTGNGSWLCCCLPKPRTVKMSLKWILNL